MFGFPKGTEFGKRIPKQKFYENLNVSASLKRVFVEQIRSIYWRNKIAPSTINIASGLNVSEVQVFEITLPQKGLDEAVLAQIDKEIPYHILFLLSFEGEYQAWISYKEYAASGSNAFKVGRYYHTDWMTEEKLNDILQIEGLSMDAVYENFVRQIAGGALGEGNEESLKESVEKDEKRKNLEKRIAALQKKIKKEKQLNRQMELSGELKKLRKELEGINGKNCGTNFIL